MSKIRISKSCSFPGSSTAVAMPTLPFSILPSPRPIEGQTADNTAEGGSQSVGRPVG